MPDAETIRQLLARRFPRALDARRDRLELRYRYDLHSVLPPIIVRLVCVDRNIRDMGEFERAAEDAMPIIVNEHLGGDEFVVRLSDTGWQNTLALQGHLDVTRGGFQLIAI